eukprot:UC4_evm3s866
MQRCHNHIFLAVGAALAFAKYAKSIEQTTPGSKTNAISNNDDDIALEMACALRGNAHYVPSLQHATHGHACGCYLHLGQACDGTYSSGWDSSEYGDSKGHCREDLATPIVNPPVIFYLDTCQTCKCVPVGCDGIKYSSTVLDSCGICGGDGSRCVGCPLGSLRDNCGVCGGSNLCTKTTMSPNQPSINTAITPRLFLQTTKAHKTPTQNKITKTSNLSSSPSTPSGLSGSSQASSGDHSSSEGLHTWQYVAIACGCVLIFGAFIVVFIFYRLNKSHEDWIEQHDSGGFGSAIDARDSSKKRKSGFKESKKSSSRYRYKKCRAILRQDVELLERIGAGGMYSELYKAVLKEKGKSAVPVVAIVSPDSTDGSQSELQRVELKRLRTETQLMNSLQHHSILSLFGVVSPNKPGILVIEYMSNGRLDHYLQTHDTSLSTQLNMALSIAEGMKYLCEKGHCMGDLASRNILVSQYLRCKIFNLSISSLIPPNAMYYISKTGNKNLRWCSPELVNTEKYTEQSDVWSYGLLLYELWTDSRIPYSDWPSEEVMLNTLTKLREGFVLPVPSNCPSIMHDLMCECWAPSPNRRPTFDHISSTLLEFANTPFFSDAENIIAVMEPEKQPTPMFSNIGNMYASSSGRDSPTSVALSSRTATTDVPYDSPMPLPSTITKAEEITQIYNNLKQQLSEVTSQMQGLAKDEPALQENFRRMSQLQVIDPPFALIRDDSSPMTLKNKVKVPFPDSDTKIKSERISDFMAYLSPRGSVHSDVKSELDATHSNKGQFLSYVSQETPVMDYSDKQHPQGVPKGMLEAPTPNIDQMTMSNFDDYLNEYSEDETLE